MPDYHAILSRAVASLDGGPQARAVLFERARGVLINGIESDPGRWTDEAASSEIAKFDAAIERIEADRAACKERLDRTVSAAPAGWPNRARIRAAT